MRLFYDSVILQFPNNGAQAGDLGEVHVVPAGYPKHLQNQGEPHRIRDGFIAHTAWRLHQPTADKLFQVFKSLLGSVPHAEPKCFPAGAYHGEDDQGWEEAHDDVAHELHQLVSATDREAAWSKDRERLSFTFAISTTLLQAKGWQCHHSRSRVLMYGLA